MVCQVDITNQILQMGKLRLKRISNCLKSQNYKMTELVLESSSA